MKVSGKITKNMAQVYGHMLTKTFLKVFGKMMKAKNKVALHEVMAINTKWLFQKKFLIYILKLRWFINQDIIIRVT